LRLDAERRCREARSRLLVAERALFSRCEALAPRSERLCRERAVRRARISRSATASGARAFSSLRWVRSRCCLRSERQL